jgi:hypothetical protein
MLISLRISPLLEVLVTWNLSLTSALYLICKTQRMTIIEGMPAAVLLPQVAIVFDF